MEWSRTLESIFLGRQDKDPVDNEAAAAVETSSNITKGLRNKFLVGSTMMHTCNSHGGSQVKRAKDIFMHTKLPALLIAVDDDDGRVSVLV